VLADSQEGSGESTGWDSKQMQDKAQWGMLCHNAASSPHLGELIDVLGIDL
jgi:hypothetical protein